MVDNSASQWSISKQVLVNGEGLDCPNPRSHCDVKIELTACYFKNVKNSNEHQVMQEFCGYLINEKGSIQLDYGVGIFSQEIDALFQGMKAGETLEVHVTLKKAFKQFPQLEKFTLKLILFSFEVCTPLYKLTAGECIELATNFKAICSDQFSASHIEVAGMFYIKSIRYLIIGQSHPSCTEAEMCDSNNLLVLCYTNLAACQLKCGLFQFAIDNCSSALEIDKSAIKAIYRRATAYIALNDYEKADIDVLSGLNLESNNKSLLHLKMVCQKHNLKQDKIMSERLKSMFL